MVNATVGIIGGSGLYEMSGLTDLQEANIETPFGSPSDVITVGKMNGVQIAFVPRHGRGHRFTPTEIPARANIYALKSIGVERIVSVSAVGSLREEIHPLDLVVPDQLIDRTRLRPNTFFGEGIVVHVQFAQPFCPELSALLFTAAQETGATVHQGGTYVVMEGPAFSTKAESNLYQSWDADIIGMTALPEAKLAREAEICYATLACTTDYDCWHESEESVSVKMVVNNLLKNTIVSKNILKTIIPRIPRVFQCGCGTALDNAILTARDVIALETKRRLEPIIGRYVN